MAPPGRRTLPGQRHCVETEDMVPSAYPSSVISNKVRYNWDVDVLITPEARREVEGLRVVRPAASTWGFLLGHKRGFRFIVEKVFLAGSGRTLPDKRLITGLDGIWPGGVIGLFAVRPGAAFRRAVLGPLWYGKLVLSLGPTSRRPSILPFVVEFDRKFLLQPVALADTGKTNAHE
jgi:hypothetical protein